VIYYSNLYNKLSSEPLPGMEYQVLNELPDENPKRSDKTCMKYTRFLFEHDDISMESQMAMLEEKKPYIVRATYSGSKSIHMIVEFSPEYNMLCEKWYKQIWKWLEKNYFPGTDTKCSNPSRLTRAPSVTRSDTGKEQKLLYEEPDNYIDKVPGILERLSTAEREWRCEQDRINTLNTIYSCSGTHSGFRDRKRMDNFCATFDNVQKYLKTPFPKIRGNGCSSTLLFGSVCACIKFNDQETLRTVLSKARREHWSEHELERVQNEALRRVEKDYMNNPRSTSKWGTRMGPDLILKPAQVAPPIPTRE
jgi:hypothetical protein